MPASFSIKADPARDLIRITMAGFFDIAGLVGFDAARHRAHDDLRCPPNRHCTLVDLRACMLQPQDVVEAFRAMIVDPGTRARRLALVTGDAAVRMQARRLVNGDNIRCFADIGEAQVWLAEPPQGYALAG